jgi:hypothetical protein
MVLVSCLAVLPGFVWVPGSEALNVGSCLEGVEQMKLESSEQMPDPALDSLGRPYSEPRSTL